MMVELLERHLDASMAADEIYGYIERHDEWDNEKLMKSYEYFSEMANHYIVALECAKEDD